ncbi:MAG TPA: phosphoenolpyruvate-utilizing N-terminal domain-containing protein, partial [Polyangiaceae bacterium]|nr:phosphoenolpyruvate-utilizing N-terminal domain-containing protein [Polyangiaceae bacterium]
SFWVMVIAFGLIRLAPGDPVLARLGAEAEPAAIDQMRRALGLDVDPVTQFVQYFWSLLHGSLGKSMENGREVMDVILSSLPVTLWIIAVTIIMSLAVSVPLALYIAMTRHASVPYIFRATTSVFLAVPVCGRRGPLGALVLQRTAGAFTSEDIALVALMGGLLAAGISQAELLDARRERKERRAGGGTRKVTLPGRPFVPGRALGAVAALRRPSAHPVERTGEPEDPKQELRRLRGAFDVAEKAITALAEKARHLRLGEGARFLGTYLEILGDQRFRERALELVESGGGVAHALSRVAREVTRTAASVTRDPFLEERARDVEDLCDALSMLAVTDKRAELPSRAILVGDALTVFDLLVSARAQPEGVALSERAFGPRTSTLLTLLDVPAIVGVQGLFRWASDGDIAVLDADHGLLVINPTKGEIASVRELRRADVGRRAAESSRDVGGGET